LYQARHEFLQPAGGCGSRQKDLGHRRLEGRRLGELSAKRFRGDQTAVVVVNRRHGARLLGRLELIARRLREIPVLAHRVVDREPRRPQRRHEPQGALHAVRQRAGPANHVQVRPAPNRRRHQAAILQQFAEHHVAHAKTERRQVHAAKVLEQIVVPAAAADRAQFATRVEQLKHDARVVRETAHDREVHVDPVAHAERVEVREVAVHATDRRGNVGLR
jgi:hypothetical protein